MFDPDFLNKLAEEREVRNGKVQPIRKSTARETRTSRNSSERYQHRIPKHDTPFKHKLFWLLHNCVAHPLLGLLPNHKSVGFHDLTSEWLNRPQMDDYDNWDPTPRSRTPYVEEKNRALWLLHNLVVHPAIGLFPCEFTFELHDLTADAMEVDGWV